MRHRYKMLLLLGTLLLSQFVMAEEETKRPEKALSKAEAFIIKLQEQGILTKEQAWDMLQDARRERAQLESETEVVVDEVLLRKSVDALDVKARALEKKLKRRGLVPDDEKLVLDPQPPKTEDQILREQAADGSVKVSYVPQFIRDEIRQKVREDLRDDVEDIVTETAKQERWGVPGALPDWIARISVSGDVRARAEAEFYGDDNLSNSDMLYLNYQEINDLGGVSYGIPNYTQNEDIVHNSENERSRLRVRARLKFAMDLNPNWKAGIRLVTGRVDNPVSTNLTLGDYGSKSQLLLDQAYVDYGHRNGDGFHDFGFTAGMFANPFHSSNLVWDEDLSFSGLAARYRYDLSGGADNSIVGDGHFLYASAGAFQIEEFANDQDDKWFSGIQLGYFVHFNNDDKLNVSLARYRFYHTAGRLNPEGSRIYDYTIPQYMQKGNTLFNIMNPVDPADRSLLFGLASDFELYNLTLSYDYAGLDPLHIRATLDMVKNVGYDEDKIRRRVGGELGEQDRVYPYGELIEDSGGNIITVGSVADEKTSGAQLFIDIGAPEIRHAGDWIFTFGYKYIEADAVIDAFTDSDFHLGGTDAQGWYLKATVGLGEHISLRGSYYSTDEVDGYPGIYRRQGEVLAEDSVPFDIDLLQIDLMAEF